MARPCPTGKQQFATSKAALTAVYRARRSRNRRRHERSAYQCDQCGQFHLTSLEPGNGERFA